MMAHVFNIIGLVCITGNFSSYFPLHNDAFTAKRVTRFTAAVVLTLIFNAPK